MSSNKNSTYSQSYHPAVTASHSARTAEREGSFILPHLRPYYDILDVGCGPGTISLGFAARVPQGSLTGIDLEQEVLDQANSHLSQQNSSRLRNVTFEVGNVVDGLKYKDASFDVVFCNQVLIHIPHPVRALQEMKRVCKPGGFVACRESDFPFRWYPYLQGLQLYDKYLYEQIFGRSTDGSSEKHPQNPPHPEGHRRGTLLHVWAREAGFDVKKMVKGAGTEVYSTEETRKAYAEIILGRFERGGYVDKWKGLGATGEEIDAVIRDVKAWAEDVDGWFAILQGEIICGV